MPLAHPEEAQIVNMPRIFADAQTGQIAGLWKGGAHGEGTQTTTATNHVPRHHRVSGARAGGRRLLGQRASCSTSAIRPIPTRIFQVIDPNFAYWHSATFNNDASKVVFTDEWGGGTQPRCRVTDKPQWGADAFFTLADRKLTPAGYYKLPAAQTEFENCVAHNGSLIPVPGRDIMVQAWYQGGISVIDFTDADHPVEIAYFDRGPLDAEKLVLGGYWSAYWYNGRIVGSEIARGLDLFTLKPSKLLSWNEIEAAKLVRFDQFNAQLQPKFEWPASFVVARAYLDQLGRSTAVARGWVQRTRGELQTAERRQGDARRTALTALGDRLDRDADGSGDAARVHALAEVVRRLSGR